MNLRTDFGGGDALLIEVTPQQIVDMMPRVQSTLLYSARANEMLISTMLAGDTSETDPSTLKQAKKLKRILFSNPNKNIYTQIEKTKIDVRLKEPCRDRSGKEVDGSVHNVKSGDICISAQRLSKKLKSNHAFGSVLGLVMHEIVHRLAGDKVEDEAKLLESFVLDTPESVSHQDWLLSIIDKLLEAEDSLKNQIEIAQFNQRLIQDQKLDEEQQLKLINTMCFDLGKMSATVKAATEGSLNPASGFQVSAIRIHNFAVPIAAVIQMTVVDNFCGRNLYGHSVNSAPKGMERILTTNDIVSVYEYITEVAGSNLTEENGNLTLIRKSRGRIGFIRPMNLKDLEIALALQLTDLRELLVDTGRSLEVPYHRSAKEGEAQYEILQDISVPSLDQRINTPDSQQEWAYFSNGTRVREFKAGLEYCQISHTQFFPSVLVGKSSDGGDLIPTSAGPLTVDEIDGYNVMFLSGNYKGTTLGVAIACGKFTADNGHTDGEISTQLFEKHLKGYIREIK